MSEIQPFFARAVFGFATRGRSEGGYEQFAIDIGQTSLSQSQKLKQLRTNLMTAPIDRGNP